MVNPAPLHLIPSDEKDIEIARLRAMIEQNEREIARLESLLERRDLEIERKGLELARKDLELARKDQEIDRAKQEDHLTGLGNRAAFDNALAGLSHSGRGFSAVMIDIDHFKQINDQYGHPEGDRMLVTLADIVRRVSHANDVCVRLGGEEFVVILPDANMDGARSYAERLRQKILDRLQIEAHDGQIIRATASLGVAEYHSGEGTNAFYRRMDHALYSAKQAGRNCIRIAE